MALAFLSPSLLGLLVFVLGPTAFSLAIGFTDWNGLQRPVWVGLGNYGQLFSDDLFGKSLANTVLYTAEFIPLTLVSCTVLALLINRTTAGISVVRVLFFLPIVTDMISVSFVWTWIYHYRFGVLNYILSLVGIAPQAWLGDARWALFALVILSVWRWAGYFALILVAGLQGIPKEVQEAALIDGAGRRQLVTKITLPLLTPTLFFVITTGIMSSLQVFEQMWVMTKGGPLNSTISICMLLYRQGFQFLKMGYASAIAWVLFLLIFGVTAINWMLRRSWVFED